MSSSMGLTRRIGQLRLPIWLTVSARALPPLALIGMLLPTNPAESQKLTLDAKWPGQYDSENGARPAAGYPLPICAPWAAPTIAVGGTTYHWPIHLAANYNYGEFQTNGVPPFQEPLSSFFNNLLPNQQVVVEASPQLLFDGGPAARFVLATAARTISNNVAREAWITIGASASQDIATNPSDCTFAIDANIQPGGPPTDFYPDSLRLGMTADSVVMIADMYDFNTDAFQYSKLWVVRKSDIYNPAGHSCPAHNPTPAIVSGFKLPGGSIAADVVPAKSYDTKSSVTYLVSARGVGDAKLALWSLDTQQLTLSPGLTGSGVPTAPYAPPPAAAQKGTTTQISTLDARLANAVYQPTSGLWTVHTVACADNAARSCMKWYQIDPRAGTAVQDGSFEYTDSSIYSPSVAVNRRGDAVFAYNYSGPNYYVGFYAVGRYAGSPLNTLQLPEMAIINGVGPYVRPQGTFAPGRNTSVDTDPTDDNRFWMLGAVAAGTFTFDGNPLPCKGSNQVVYDWATEVGTASFR
jgi:hypothetical protein